jgi:hypothetical protein
MIFTGIVYINFMVIPSAAADYSKNNIVRNREKSNASGITAYHCP